MSSPVEATPSPYDPALSNPGATDPRPDLLTLEELIKEIEGVFDPACELTEGRGRVMKNIPSLA
ncbi:hypothetical protein FWD20_04150, partial [Candidatus Saccharibacteria bacterium]|nr:hypothetical protein [Candidatus Saccharibacteria bacterium]